MKKTIATSLLTIASSFGFAQEAAVEQPALIAAAPIEIAAPLPKVEEANPSFAYIRMDVSDSKLNELSNRDAIPGLGIGYRIVSGASAIDISANYNRGPERYVASLPKVNYFHYLSAAQNQSFYAGAGLAWGWIKSTATEETERFQGLVSNVALGYEMNRKGAIRGFAQLDVGQATLAATQTGSLPKTFAELSVGAGF
ncbi:MAG: hypothetical protein A3E80_01325 [Chlamydiae bacterium RIFCSPHIGHO2_12_FULL_49_9]|nr:MAG: hypothetical protein A3E80_01325 [Chlamydiae bacterium RIFCSPHIGHO2_12_FULL_49_9]